MDYDNTLLTHFFCADDFFVLLGNRKLKENYRIGSLITLYGERLYTSWIFEKLQVSLLLLLIIDTLFKTFSNAHVKANIMLSDAIQDNIIKD
jgi:hypothetical protein